MSKRKTIQAITEEQLARIDRGEHLWKQLHEGIQLADPEDAERIEIIREALYSTLARMSDWWIYDSEEGKEKLANYAKYAYTWRNALSILFADLHGHKVPDIEREKWLTRVERDEPFKSLLDVHRKPAQGEAVH